MRICPQKTSTPTQQPHEHKVPLQNIPLPTFDGTHAKYHRFISSFEKTIAKYNLSDFEKFSYLVKSVADGPARQLMDIVSESTMDYPTAKALLDKAYPLGHVQQDAIIKEVVNLKFDPKEPFKWISAAEVFKIQVDSANITGHIFLQYFLWNSLNDNYRQKLAEITQKSRPSVAEICDKFYEAKLRVGDIEELEKTSKSKDSVSTLALTASSSVKPKDKKREQRVLKCVLCEQQHKSSQCTKYSNSSQKQKRLKELNRCTKCMLSNHASQDCRYRFQNKCACGGSHYQFLCMTKPKSNADASSSSEAQSSDATSVSSNSKSVVISLPSQSVAKGSILPSFTASIFASDGSLHDCRAFCDTCNETTLIETDFARKLKLKTIDKNIQLTLKGINSNKHITTETVQFELNIGREKHRIIALCIPDVSVDLQIENLDTLLDKFRGQNYSIADKSLSSSHLSGAKLLLGSDHVNILLSEIGKFGEEGTSKSIYFRTPIGVMFIGRVEKMIQDAQFLQPDTTPSL